MSVSLLGEERERKRKKKWCHFTARSRFSKLYSSRCPHRHEFSYIFEQSIVLECSLKIVSITDFRHEDMKQWQSECSFTFSSAKKRFNLVQSFPSHPVRVLSSRLLPRLMDGHDSSFGMSVPIRTPFLSWHERSVSHLEKEEDTAKVSYWSQCPKSDPCLPIQERSVFCVLFCVSWEQNSEHNLVSRTMDMEWEGSGHERTLEHRAGELCPSAQSLFPRTFDRFLELISRTDFRGH